MASLRTPSTLLIRCFRIWKGILSQHSATLRRRASLTEHGGMRVCLTRSSAPKRHSEGISIRS